MAAPWRRWRPRTSWGSYGARSLRTQIIRQEGTGGGRCQCKSPTSGKRRLPAGCVVSVHAAAGGNALIHHGQELILQPAISRSTAAVLYRRLPVSPERLSATLAVKVLVRFRGLCSRADDRKGGPWLGQEQRQTRCKQWCSHSGPSF